MLAAAVSTAIHFWASLAACGAVVDRSPLLAAALVAGSGSLLAARGLFGALGRHAILVRSIVALWAVTFYVAALLALNYILSLFLHCPPS